VNERIDELYKYSTVLQILGLCRCI